MSSPEERIIALEKQLTAMETEYRQAVALVNYLGGSERVFQAATLVMAAAHPHKDAFEPLLMKILERTSVSVLFGSANDDHVRGVEDAKALLLEHLYMR